MRLGILGGTFDPVHYGHLLLAEICRQQISLQQVRFIPAARPPHKPDLLITDGHARADMLEFALAGYPEFVVDRRELKRSGPSCTVDTLLEFRAQCPDAELFLLVGADSLRDFLTWKSPEQISTLSTIVVCNRPGVALPDRQQVKEWTGDQIAANVKFVQIPGTDLSATDLRQRIREGVGLRFMTPRAVECYIKEHKLYVDQSSCSTD